MRILHSPSLAAPLVSAGQATGVVWKAGREKRGEFLPVTSVAADSSSHEQFHLQSYHFCTWKVSLIAPSGPPEMQAPASSILHLSSSSEFLRSKHLPPTRRHYVCPSMGPPGSHKPTCSFLLSAQLSKVRCLLGAFSLLQHPVNNS